jgi:hypothetical protein
MTWAIIGVLSACLVWLFLRIRRIVQDMRRMSQVHHDAANRAMRRHRRDQWRFREIKSTLGIIADFTESPVDIPDLEAGPPDDPESG